MRPLPIRATEMRELAARRVHRQPVSASPLPKQGGLGGSLLSLQRTHGNRYVQRLLAVPAQQEVETPAGVEQTIQRTRGGGQALPPSVRLDMESAFGVDFSTVRLHTDAGANVLNHALAAVAFTTGRDIYFRHGEYDPHGVSGRRLLAHELTHVVQQAGSAPGARLVVGATGDKSEQEADQMAETVADAVEHPTSGRRPAAGAARSGSIQRMCAHCEENLQQPIAKKEDEEQSPDGMRPGLAGGSSRGLGVVVARRKLLGGVVAGKIQRQPLTKRGNIGCPVPELQEALNATGEALVVDGNFGPLTQAAVRRFQTAHHPPLVVDGEVGPATWPVLHTAAPGDHGLPAGETTTSNGWDGGGIHRWRQRLTPITTHFGSATPGRCQVTEADGGGGADTCHFPGSAFAPFTAVTGGTWDVDASNRWGDDFVGWFGPAVNFYRTNGRAPCSATFTQSMRVVRPGGNVEYRQNVLTSDIGLTTVSSTRDGHTETRPFP